MTFELSRRVLHDLARLKADEITGCGSRVAKSRPLLAPALWQRLCEGARGCAPAAESARDMFRDRWLRWSRRRACPSSPARRPTIGSSCVRAAGARAVVPPGGSGRPRASPLNADAADAARHVRCDPRPDDPEAEAAGPRAAPPSAAGQGPGTAVKVASWPPAGGDRRHRGSVSGRRVVRRALASAQPPPHLRSQE